MKFWLGLSVLFVSGCVFGNGGTLDPPTFDTSTADVGGTDAGSSDVRRPEDTGPNDGGSPPDAAPVDAGPELEVVLEPAVPYVAESFTISVVPRECDERLVSFEPPTAGAQIPGTDTFVALGPALIDIDCDGVLLNTMVDPVGPGFEETRPDLWLLSHFGIRPDVNDMNDFWTWNSIGNQLEIYYEARDTTDPVVSPGNRFPRVEFAGQTILGADWGIDDYPGPVGGFRFTAIIAGEFTPPIEKMNLLSRCNMGNHQFFIRDNGAAWEFGLETTGATNEVVTWPASEDALTGSRVYMLQSDTVEDRTALELFIDGRSQGVRQLDADQKVAIDFDQIGGRCQSGHHLRASLMEVMLYEQTLDNEQRTAVTNYLLTKLAE